MENLDIYIEQVLTNPDVKKEYEPNINQIRMPLINDDDTISYFDTIIYSNHFYATFPNQVVLYCVLYHIQKASVLELNICITNRADMDFDKYCGKLILI